ncbi:hypothetical protein AVEN_25472-1 [Araneus ventricosus]|uniref:Uncharacterized protein n=1 Tax=Araneus ventricosus TaxID=182803 RepID=A0A4Y2CS26_ARAVE|nr:hypothetical protein AVEN_25472-1 [Araneus ventricosus]
MNGFVAHPYRPAPLQALLDVEGDYGCLSFIMNHLVVQSMFLEDMIWMDEACFSLNGVAVAKTTSTGRLKILDTLSKFNIKYAGRLMFDMEFSITS